MNFLSHYTQIQQDVPSATDAIAPWHTWAYNWKIPRTSGRTWVVFQGQKQDYLVESFRHDSDPTLKAIVLWALTFFPKVILWGCFKLSTCLSQRPLKIIRGDAHQDILPADGAPLNSTQSEALDLLCSLRRAAWMEDSFNSLFVWFKEFTRLLKNPKHDSYRFSCATIQRQGLEKTHIYLATGYQIDDGAFIASILEDPEAKKIFKSTFTRSSFLFQLIPIVTTNEELREQLEKHWIHIFSQLPFDLRSDIYKAIAEKAKEGQGEAAFDALIKLYPKEKEEDVRLLLEIIGNAPQLLKDLQKKDPTLYQEISKKAPDLVKKWCLLIDSGAVRLWTLLDSIDHELKGAWHQCLCALIRTEQLKTQTIFVGRALSTPKDPQTQLSDLTPEEIIDQFNQYALLPQSQAVREEKTQNGFELNNVLRILNQKLESGARLLKNDAICFIERYLLPGNNEIFQERLALLLPLEFCAPLDIELFTISQEITIPLVEKFCNLMDLTPQVLKKTINFSLAVAKARFCRDPEVFFTIIETLTGQKIQKTPDLWLAFFQSLWWRTQTRINPHDNQAQNLTLLDKPEGGFTPKMKQAIGEKILTWLSNITLLNSALPDPNGDEIHAGETYGGHFSQGRFEKAFIGTGCRFYHIKRSIESPPTTFLLSTTPQRFRGWIFSEKGILKRTGIFEEMNSTLWETFKEIFDQLTLAESHTTVVDFESQECAASWMQEYGLKYSAWTPSDLIFIRERAHKSFDFLQQLQSAAQNRALNPTPDPVILARLPIAINKWKVLANALDDKKVG